MSCRRCGSPNLIKLDKKSEGDNVVFRCGLCGYIFSPAPHSNK